MSFILVLVISISEVDLFVGISDLTNSLHIQCLNFTPHSLYSNIYAALVCGKDLDGTELTQSLKNLGIYHVIIVSGSHLVFLSSLIEIFFSTPHLKKLRFVAFPILLFYSLATGFEPPVVRALASIGISALQKKNKLFWNQNEVIFISVLICLALFDPWKKSYSLLLSYVASITLSLSSRNNSLLKNLKIYLLILPFLLPLSAPSPLSFLTNMTLSPIIGLILFPLSFLTYIIPYLYVLVDPLWKLFLFVCTKLGPELQSLDKISIPLTVLWTMAISINFYGMWIEKRYP